MLKLKPNQFYLPSGALITEHPILFQTEMVQANLEDLKNQTRRTKGLDTYSEKHNPMEFFRDEFREDEWAFFALTLKDGKQTETPNLKSPYGKPGDLLWVKETWKKSPKNCTWKDFTYKSDYPNPLSELGKWKPSIHLPKAASRIWAMVEDIRVERLHEISEEDAKAEGVKVGKSGNTYFNYTPNYERTTQFVYDLYSAKDSFNTLWKSINGRESFDSNPWVWVIKYRILSKTGRPSMDVIERTYSEIVNQKTEIVHA